MTSYQKKRKACLLEEFECDTGFQFICCNCNQFKSKSVSIKAEKLSLELQEKYLIKDEGVNMSKDGKFYICKSCYEKVKNGKEKSVENKDLMELSPFSKDLLEEVKKVSKVDEVLLNNIENLDLNDPEKLRKRYENDALMLNKLESFILKLVIPFVRVAHCKRGRYMMVNGNLVLI